MSAFFKARVDGFLSTPESEGLDSLTAGLTKACFDVSPDQRAAWVEEWGWLRDALAGLIEIEPSVREWGLLIEFPVPGRSKRIDAVLLTPHGIVVIEFKRSAGDTSSARWQVREYCWNLRDFHAASREASVAPILCLGDHKGTNGSPQLSFSDRYKLVLDLQVCGASELAKHVRLAFQSLKARPAKSFNLDEWDGSRFEPTPSVIEFAQEIFGNHDVREIAHAHSDNTEVALNRILAVIQYARESQKRLICFVTGVPGAGKTLVGLNAAYRREMVEAAGGPICFATGNRPLRDVIATALVRNRTRGRGQRRELGHTLAAPIQDVHDYVRTNLGAESQKPPAFRSIVFDEAQRVWNKEKLLDGLNTRKRRGQLSKEQIERILSYGSSEPELLLSLMEMCPEWCVVVALVGGGQEIHEGEAGLGEWGRALSDRKNPWTVWTCSEALAGGIGSAHQRLFDADAPSHLPVVRHEDLHLSTSKRSIRAERYAEWVNRILQGDRDRAFQVATELAEFPVFLVRDLSKAREFLSTHVDPALRSGLLASSGGMRLRADGIEVSAQFRQGIKFPDWFLRPKGDIRSSSQLEVAATEFECQGLELDWCCVCWSADFWFSTESKSWQFSQLRFPGGNAARWSTQKNPETCEYVRNKYRVLLTRARLGVVIYVPKGDISDPTRKPSSFDGTADFLLNCGAIAL